jgi:hypothetical protein
MSEAPVGAGAITPAAEVRSLASARRDPATTVVVVLALVAAGLQVLSLTRPNALLAGWSDTSIYLGAAVRFVHGALPYRDVALLQPPGLLLLISPFGLLSMAVGTRVALMALTAGTPLLAAANVALVGRLTVHRGWRAPLAACGLMAVYPATYTALLDGMLEPLMCFFCLLGAVLVFDRDGLAGRRRLAAGGVAFGFGVSVLVAAALPMLVVIALCASRLRQRLLPLMAGGAAGILIPVIPFFAAAPAAFVQDTVVAQLDRVPGSGRTPVTDRLTDMTLAAHGGGVIGAVVALAVLGVVIALGLTAVRCRLTELEWFALGGALSLGAVQFAIAIYFSHFPAMWVPYPALLLGIAVARLSSRWAPRLIAAVVALAVAGLVVGQAALIESQSIVDVGPWVDAVVPVNGCAIASNTYLVVSSNRFESSVAGCTTFTDPASVRLVYQDSPDGGVPAYRAALDHTDYLVLNTTLSNWLSGPYAPLFEYVTGHFRLHHSGPLNIYVRDGYPVA